MYTREQIIEEIKRIAKKKGGKALMQSDFELESTVPISTLKFYMGSWKRALEEAGLKSMFAPESDTSGRPHPTSDDDLLLDLVRLYEDSGEVPTLALIKAKGKYSDQLYTTKWKSVNDAFLLAREKFPKKLKPIEIQKEKPVPARDEGKKEKKKSLPEAEKTIVEKLDPEMDLLKIPDIEIEEPLSPKPLEPVKLDSVKKTPDKKEVPVKEIPDIEIKESASPLLLDSDMSADFVEQIPDETEKPQERKIKFIPTTIKPKKIKEKPILGEPIHFRGLRFAPATKQGVIYLFGMISSELGFIIESFTTEYPDCEGRRCLDPEEDRWERVSIQFAYKSSDFKSRSYDEKSCDILVCWSHDWDKCPLEVLELSSTIKQLD